MPKLTQKFAAKKIVFKIVFSEGGRGCKNLFGSENSKSGVKATSLIIGQALETNSIGRFPDFDRKYGDEDEKMRCARKCI